MKTLRTFAAFVAFVLMLTACGGGTTTPPTPTLDPVAARGKRIFSQHCAACHSLSPDTIIVGPSLAGIATRAAERVPGMDARTYIEQSILKPDAYIVEGFPNAMPNEFGKKLSGEELDALVHFLLTLQ
ncbi:c-type cytochrome [Ardenticatena maritima]|uniref:c-type cytochrome n=1 Tax=Ardenticatena maritima TaxID=872965 RepID=UPI0006C83920|nr:cytochrome c [Ardenticatena maritima]